MKNKVFIVKLRWNDEVNGQVKRVFINEKNALDFINEYKLIDRYKDAEWILSDREISDFEPGISETDLKIAKIEATQNFIEATISALAHPNTPPNFDVYRFLEGYWAIFEQERINLDGE